MAIKTGVGILAAALMCCASANGLAMERVGIAPMKRVEVAPMKRVEVAPMKRVEVAPMQRVQVAPIKRYRRTSPVQSSTQAEAERRGKVIDPKGQGLNQAQINAMERQRQLMWNATGGNMVYR